MRETPALFAGKAWRTIAIWAAFGLLLIAQAGFSSSRSRQWTSESSPGVPPSEKMLRMASLGEEASAAYAMTLYLQTFDAQAGQSLALRTLDGAQLRAWLNRTLDLYPNSAYPLLLASRIYAEAARPEDARALLELVHQRFLMVPDQRWPWLAHALFVARHTLRDMPLALRFARSLREHATGPSVPSWVRQAELLLLADLDDKQTARVLLGALIASGQLTDDNERSFLMSRLQRLERHVPSDAAPETKEDGATTQP